jgi:hypothetical protein
MTVLCEDCEVVDLFFVFGGNVLDEESDARVPVSAEEGRTMIGEQSDKNRNGEKMSQSVRSLTGGEVSRLSTRPGFLSMVLSALAKSVPSVSYGPPTLR